MRCEFSRNKTCRTRLRSGRTSETSWIERTHRDGATGHTMGQKVREPEGMSFNLLLLHNREGNSELEDTQNLWCCCVIHESRQDHFKGEFCSVCCLLKSRYLIDVSKPKVVPLFHSFSHSFVHQWLNLMMSKGVVVCSSFLLLLLHRVPGNVATKASTNLQCYRLVRFSVCVCQLLMIQFVSQAVKS